MKEWPNSTTPFKKNPPMGTVGIIMPVRSALRFARLSYYSIRYFTDIPYMLVFMNNQSNLETKKALVGISKNHQVWCFDEHSDFNKSKLINMGIKHCFENPEIKYGMCIDSDIIVEPEWLSQLVETLTLDDKNGITSPRMNVLPALSYGEITGSCMLFRREVYEQLNGFNETLSDGHQDIDFCMRAEEAGYYCPVSYGTHVLHFGGATLKTLAHQLEAKKEDSIESFVNDPVKEGYYVRAKSW